jgi:outer membrane lipoprotein carrier protein
MGKLIIVLSVICFDLFAFDFKSIDTYKADFSQTITNPSGKEIFYKGQLFIKKPLNILWKYQDPIEKDVYLIDQKVTIIEPDLEQAIVSKLDKQINILKVLQDGKKIDTNKYKAILHNKPYVYEVNDNKLTSITYKDDVDNHVMITFSNIVQNEALDEQRFNFNIPSYFDIIRK